MNNKKVFVIMIILTVCLFILSGCNTKDVQNNTKNTSTTTSIREQLMVQQNLVQGLQQTSDSKTENIKLEDLEVWNKVEDTNYTTFKYSNGASFMYPSDWVSKGNETNPAFMSSDAHSSSVSIASDNVLKEGTSSIITDFESYITFTKLYLTQKMTLLSNIEEKWINLNGKKACIINYLTEAEEDDDMKLRVTQVSFEHDKEISIMTLVVIDKYYEEVKPTLEKMIKSFTK